MSAGLDISGIATFDDPSTIRKAVDVLKSATRAVHATAAEVHVEWCRLAGAYNAPEQVQVIAAMTPPSEMALQLTERVATAETALEAYADQLGELEAHRRTLILDILTFTQDRAAIEADNADNTAWESVKDHYRNEAVELAQREEALHDQIVALQVAKDRAENDCVNAIGDLWGASDYHLNGETSVLNSYRYGKTADGYEHQASLGQAPWGRPASWTEGNLDVKLHRIDRGAKDSLWGVRDAGFDLAGWNGHGRADASRSGMVQFGNDVWNQTRWSGFHDVSEAEQRASAERLGHVGQAAIGWGTWSHDGWHTAGGFIPDVTASYVTGGTFLGARTAGRGALSARVPPGMSLNPSALAPAVRTLAYSRMSSARIRLGTFLDANHPTIGPFDGHSPALAGSTAGMRPQSTPAPSLWAMDTGGHAKGSANVSAAPPEPRPTRDVPPVDWGEHAEISERYSPEIRGAVAPIIDRAVAAEPAVTRNFLAVLPENARAHGLEHRIKSPDSLAHKAARKSEGLGPGQLNTGMDDVLRFTAVTSSADELIPAAEKTVANLQADGWTIKRAQQTYVTDNPYKGIHCIAYSEDLDVSIELQFHTEFSQQVKDATHSPYEIARDREVPESVRLAADAESREASSAIPHPAGLDAFTHLGGTPVEIIEYPRLRR